jgi:hypothetical protein
MGPHPPPAVNLELTGALAEAVITADHLGAVADALIGHFVDQARRSARRGPRSGAAWA